MAWGIMTACRPSWMGEQHQEGRCCCCCCRCLCLCRETGRREDDGVVELEFPIRSQKGVGANASVPPDCMHRSLSFSLSPVVCTTLYPIARTALHSISSSKHCVLRFALLHTSDLPSSYSVIVNQQSTRLNRSWRALVCIATQMPACPTRSREPDLDYASFAMPCWMVISS